MYSIAQLISAVAAILAAVFWLWSALVHIPANLDMMLSGPKSPAGYMKKQSKLSAVAATFAAVAALTQAFVIYAQP